MGLASPKKKTIDARGLFCPGPLRVLEGVIQHVDSGTLIELLADDLDSKEEVGEWCKSTGNTLISVEEKEGSIAFLVRKT